jgi:hypothetical protein|tara:strand:+ start:1202 stop:1453 length:252 start_codon:yes stop_codon:yes gene_type:complete
MRNSPLKQFAGKANSQGLNPEALATKRASDLAAAKTPARMEKKKENQKIGQSSNYDIHHKSDGSTAKISTASNRDVWKRNERT